jgi:hypothetical protein
MTEPRCGGGVMVMTTQATSPAPSVIRFAARGGVDTRLAKEQAR